MFNNNAIAQNILEQIKFMDRMALMAWGANEFVVIQNGLQFKIRTPKYQRGVRVQIRLNYRDLYDIKVIRIRNTEVKELESMNDVYFDMLVETLDNLIDEKEKVFF